MDEKRKTVRVEKPVVVQYAHNSNDPMRPLIWDETTIKNISIEGILLNSHKLFAKNEMLQLRFRIPADPSNCLKVMGQVVESTTSKIRIKFVNLDEYQKKVIGDYVGIHKKNK